MKTNNTENRTDSIAAIINALSVLPKDRLDAVMEAIGTADGNIKAVENDEKEAAEAALKESIEKDLIEAFGDESITEDMRTRLSTLFESALNTRLNLEVENISATMNEQIEAEVEDRIAELTEGINEYITYAAEQWITENQVAVENSLRNEISESFMEYIREGFMAHNIEVPEGKADMVETLEDRVAELENRLNEAYEENIELTAILNESGRDAVMADMTEDLTMTQASKLRQLAEGIEANDADVYANKVGILKEKYFPVKKSTKTGLLIEDVDDGFEVETPKTVQPNMSKYLTTLNSISNPTNSKK